jgi:hypothetical protein
VDQLGQALHDGESLDRLVWLQFLVGV